MLQFAALQKTRLPMISVVLPLTALRAGVALLLAGSGLLGTLLAVRGGLEGFDEQTLGLGPTYAGQLGLDRSGHDVDRWGRDFLAAVAAAAN